MNRFLLVVLVVSSTACTSIYQRRGTESSLPAISIDELPGTTRVAKMRQVNLEARSIERFAEATIGIIEFDDDGNTNPAQKQMVLEMLRRETDDGPALIINFVHGWHHEARVCDRDLACFRRVLQYLKTLNPERQVVGVFFGWRGESCGWKGLNISTIWNRKQTAQHIGRTGAKEVLIELQRIYQEARERELERGSTVTTTMVSVGHSLGGAMLYSAVKGQLSGNVADIERRRIGSYRVVRASEDRIEAEREQRKALRAGFGDLVVLVNPAIEAREYGVFAADLPRKDLPDEVEMLIERKYPYDAKRPYTPGQLPVLMTIASDADTAVGWIFPVAQWLSAVPFRPYQLARVAGWRGMGHYGPHTTHELRHPVLAESEVGRAGAEDACDCTKRYGTGAFDLERSDRPLDLRSKETQTFGQLEFEVVSDRRRDWDENAPYLVIKADRGVIAEHSDIFNPVFVGFLTRYIRAIELEREEEQTPKQAR